MRVFLAADADGVADAPRVVQVLQHLVPHAAFGCDLPWCVCECLSACVNRNVYVCLNVCVCVNRNVYVLSECVCVCLCV